VSMRHALTLSAKRFSIPILAPSQPEVLKGFRNMYEESNGQHLSALGLESAETELMSTRFEISPCPVAFHQLPYIIRRGFFFSGSDAYKLGPHRCKHSEEREKTI